MIVRNEKDLKGMMRIGQICGLTLQHMLAHVEPGITTQELDRIGAAFLKKHGAASAPQSVQRPAWGPGGPPPLGYGKHRDPGLDPSAVAELVDPGYDGRGQRRLPILAALADDADAPTLRRDVYVDRGDLESFRYPQGAVKEWR